MDGTSKGEIFIRVVSPKSKGPSGDVSKKSFRILTMQFGD